VFAQVKSTWVADIHFLLFLESIYRHRFLVNKASSHDNIVAVFSAIVDEALTSLIKEGMLNGNRII